MAASNQRPRRDSCCEARCRSRSAPSTVWAGAVLLGAASRFPAPPQRGFPAPRPYCAARSCLPCCSTLGCSVSGNPLIVATRALYSVRVSVNWSAKRWESVTLSAPPRAGYGRCDSHKAHCHNQSNALAAAARQSRLTGDGWAPLPPCPARCGTTGYKAPSDVGRVDIAWHRLLSATVSGGALPAVTAALSHRLALPPGAARTACGARTASQRAPAQGRVVRGSRCVSRPRMSGTSPLPVAHGCARPRPVAITAAGQRVDATTCAAPARWRRRHCRACHRSLIDGFS